MPKRQFLGLKCNCTEDSTFLAQAQVLTQRFVAKGYAPNSLSNTLDQVKNVDGKDFLSERVDGRDGDTYRCPFITNFSCQHSKVKHIMTRHWHILKNDRVLESILPDKPQVVFRGVPSLKDRLAPNILNPPTNRPNFFSELTGYYQCRRFQVCSLNRCRTRRNISFTSTCTSKTFSIEPFITCFTVGVVYMFQCLCGLQYVGRIKRPLQVCLNEHINNIRKDFSKHSVSKHYLTAHNRDPSNTIFLGIDKYKPYWRVSCLVRSIARLEMSWVHKLKSYTPFGLNIEVDVNSFIDNS